MPPKKDIVIKVKDADHFQQFYSETNPKLSVVDVFVDWAGPCTDLMMPTYKMLTTNYDDWEKRLEFLEVDYEKIKSLGLKTHVTCKPKFLLLFEGKIVEEINGTNVPDLLSKIDKHVPLV